jgi:hypothetical protein
VAETDAVGAEQREWSVRLGRKQVTVRNVEGRRVLRIGDWSTVLTPRTRIHHGTHTWSRTLTIRQPDRPPHVYRYRLGLYAMLAPAVEPTYDRWAAEADDPGLDLVQALGGTDDWVPWTPPVERRSWRPWRRRGD